MKRRLQTLMTSETLLAVLIAEQNKILQEFALQLAQIEDFDIQFLYNFYRIWLPPVEYDGIGFIVKSEKKMSNEISLLRYSELGQYVSHNQNLHKQSIMLDLDKAIFFAQKEQSPENSSLGISQISNETREQINSPHSSLKKNPEK